MTLIQSLRYGARLLVKHPGFSAITILTLSIGIGLTAMMFSIVNGAILRGLPFEEAHRIMAVQRNNPSEGIEAMSVPLHDFHDWREQQQAFVGLAGYTTGTFNVSGTEGGAERYNGAWLTANGFDVLRERPVLGRTFREEEESPGAAAVLVIGYRMWQDRFGGEAAVIGRTLRVNGEEAVIIGVMAEGFRFPFGQDAWLPERRSPLAYERGANGVPFLNVYGRLSPGVSREQGATQMAAIAARLALEHPESNEGVGARVIPFDQQFIGTEPRALLFTMLGAVFGVLLIACVNVANLLLSRAALRAKEVGIRTALGARRSRIVLQFLTEPLAFAVVGAVLGLGVAWIGIDLFNRAIADTNRPYWIDIRIDGMVLLFVTVVTLFATIVSGVLPAVRASGGHVTDALKDESRGASSYRGGRITKALVVAEIALSVTLLVGAGLMIKSVMKLRNVDFAFETETVFTARLGLPEADERYAEGARRVRFFEEVQAAVAAEPDVRAAALGTALPGLFAAGNRVSIEGRSYDRPGDHPFTRAVVITPTWFETFGVAVVQGRAFDDGDREGSVPVTIVNQSFVRRHFEDGDAMGRRVRLGGAESERPWMTIVGIVPDLHLSGIQNEDPAGVYTPLAQESPRFMSIAARTAGNPGALTTRVRVAVASVDPDIPIYWAFPLSFSISQEVWFYKVFGTIFMLLGFVALFLAAIGLYGVMAFSVSRRTREMGVRMALGAGAPQVMRLVMRQGLVQLAIGLAIGLAAAAGVSGLLTIVLFDVEPRDPGIFLAIVLVLVATGLLASWVPARRATRVDPLVALRYE